MADVTKTSYQLKLIAGFVDGDERTISVENPISGITLDMINNVATKAAGVLIGDKYGADFNTFKEAKYVQTTELILDLEQ